MKTLDISEATAPLQEYMQAAAHEPLLITSHGKPYMALVDVEDLDYETISVSMNATFAGIIQHSRTRHGAKGGLSGDDVRRTLGLLDE